MRINEKKLKELRELEFEKTGSHTDQMYKKESHRARMKIIIEMVREYSSDQKSILDYGCAEGLYCHEYQKMKFSSVSGVDISDKKIKLAKTLYPDVDFFYYDNFLKDTNNYDIITCFEVFQHVPNYQEILINLKNKLSINGRMIISIPNLSNSDSHIAADINNDMTTEELLKEVGGAGFGKQNAIWKFNTKLFCDELLNDFVVDKIVEVDTPDNQIKNLWTIFSVTKK